MTEAATICAVKANLKIARSALRRERPQGQRGWPALPSPPVLHLAQLIDHTNLRPEATRADIERLCQEARQYKFFSVCVNPVWVSLARQQLAGSGVKVCCVVGFPLGALPPETKAMEARAATRQGAKEIDMVINIGALKSGDDNLVLRDIRSVVAACRNRSAKCKVILETALLTNDEKSPRLRTGRQSPGRLCEDLHWVQHRRGDRRGRGADEPDRARQGAWGEGLRGHPHLGRSAPHGASRRHPHRYQQRHQDRAGSHWPGGQPGRREGLIISARARPVFGVKPLRCVPARLRSDAGCRILSSCL